MLKDKETKEKNELHVSRRVLVVEKVSIDLIFWHLIQAFNVLLLYNITETGFSLLPADIGKQYLR